MPKLAIGRIVHFTQHGPGFRGELVVPAIVTDVDGDLAWLTVCAPNQPPYTQGSVRPGKTFDAGTWHWPDEVLAMEAARRIAEAHHPADGEQQNQPLPGPQSGSPLSPAEEGLTPGSG